MPSESGISLPGVKLIPGAHDKLIAWNEYAIKNHINRSSVIRAALELYLEKGDQLDRIEDMLKVIAQNGVAAPSKKIEKEIFNDPFLDNDL
jgi:metal-responsive CopG/Arc/MetJ family transcriptional regulator